MTLPSRMICSGFLSLLLPTLAAGGKFRHGFPVPKLQHVTLQIARPPDALIEARTLQIREKTGVSFPAGAAVKLNLEQALSADFTIVPAKPDATVTFTITAYIPVTASRQVQNEKRQVVVGKETVKGLFGKPVQVDKYEERVVPVEYWVAQGSATLQADVYDGSGTLLDTFSDTATIDRRTEISVQGVASKAKGDSTPLTVEAATNELVKQLASVVKRRYTTTTDPTDALLAVDDELRDYNPLAEAGAWEKALAAYSSANMKKFPGDRMYNMAVCHEALAYAKYLRTRSADDAKPDFEQAMKLYAEARALDPGEEYFGKAEARLQKAMASFARVKEQAELRAVRMAQLQAEAEARAEEEKKKAALDQERQEAAKLEQAALESKRSDTADESDFRAVVRLRLRSLPGTPATPLLAELQQSGEKRYRLEPPAARRVVYQEEKALTDYRERVNEYRAMFGAAASDKKVTPEERGTLDRVAARLELERQELQAIEQEFGVVAPPAAIPPAKQPLESRKASTAPTPKKATPAPRVPAIPAAPKPSPAASAPPKAGKK